MEDDLTRVLPDRRGLLTILSARRPVFLLMITVLLGIMLSPIMLLIAFTVEQIPPSPQYPVYIQDGRSTPFQHEVPSLAARSGQDQVEQRQQELLANIPQATSASILFTTNYQEDSAIRQAILAGTALWREETSTHVLSYRASNALHVYLLNQ